MEEDGDGRDKMITVQWMAESNVLSNKYRILSSEKRLKEFDFRRLFIMNIMNFRTIQILLVLLIGVSAGTIVSGTVQFTKGYREQYVQIPSLNKPFAMVSIEDVRYSSPFSLELTTSLTQIPQGNYLIIKCLIGNTTYLSDRASMSVRYLVSPQIKGFQLFPVQLHSGVPNLTIIPKAANSDRIKKGYFVAGFSKFSVLDSISIVAGAENFFHIVLNSTDPTDWVAINFFTIDYSPTTGCFAHKAYDESIESLTGVGTHNLHFDRSETLETVLGINNIKSNRGRFEWEESDDGEVLVQGIGSFNVAILQLDTVCGTKDAAASGTQITEQSTNVIPIPVVPVVPVFPIDNNFNIQNGSSSTAGTSIIPIIPIDNESSSTTTNPIILPLNNISTNTQTTPQQPAESTSQPQPTPNPSQLQPLIIPPIPSAVLAPNDSSQKSLDQLHNAASGAYVEPIPTSISAWKILGFVLLAWVVISVLAIPLLCCLLWRSRKRLQQQEEIIRRYGGQNEQRISQPIDDIIDRGTDVRLKNSVGPVQMKQIPNPPEKITYEKSPSIIQTRGSQRVEEPIPIQVRNMPDIQQTLSGERSRYASEIHPNDSSLKYSKSDIKNHYSEIKNNTHLAQNQLSEIQGSPSEIRDEPLTFKDNKSKFGEPQVEAIRSQEQTIPSLIEYEKQPSLVEYQKQPSSVQQPVEENIVYENSSEGSNEVEVVGRESSHTSSPSSVIKKKESIDEVVESMSEVKPIQTPKEQTIQKGSELKVASLDKDSNENTLTQNQQEKQTPEQDTPKQEKKGQDKPEQEQKKGQKTK